MSNPPTFRRAPRPENATAQTAAAPDAGEERGETSKRQRTVSESSALVTHTVIRVRGRAANRRTGARWVTDGALCHLILGQLHLNSCWKRLHDSLVDCVTGLRWIRMPHSAWTYEWLRGRLCTGA